MFVFAFGIYFPFIVSGYYAWSFTTTVSALKGMRHIRSFSVGGIRQRPGLEVNWLK